MIRRDSSDVHGLYRYPESMMTEVLQAKAVVILTEQVSLIQVNRYCKGQRIGEFYFGDEPLFSYHFAMYMRRQLPRDLRHRLSEIVSRVEQSGIVHHYHNAKLSPVKECCRGENRSQLNFTDLVSVFYLYAACCLMGVFVMVAELIVASRVMHTHRT
ncbi:hypothetical protein HPB49_008428 [Dermacentor silvarum]|uniref:Uncharacterized protein n=1 Tax=Dermacentor silvarum TaxID=543639 RepID=A0ACB8C8G5_DERSI|nr:hypothetical protein HPB49_008428 [Dermacentor silvarum]